MRQLLPGQSRFAGVGKADDGSTALSDRVAPGRAVPHGFHSSFKDGCRNCTAYGDEVSEFALARVSRLLAERKGFTPAMAVRVGKLAGNGPGIWLRMQDNYDLWHTARKMADELRAIA